MKVARKCVLVLLGILAANSATSTSQTVAPADYGNDPRLQKLKQFFLDFKSPGYNFAEDFLLAADRNGLDWRLLPSLALLESGGGKSFSNNNILGWDSCRQSFPSVRAGIHHVASRLAGSQLYRGKPLSRVLAIYNPEHHYPQRVTELMSRIASDPVSRCGTP